MRKLEILLKENKKIHRDFSQFHRESHNQKRLFAPHFYFNFRNKNGSSESHKPEVHVEHHSETHQSSEEHHETEKHVDDSLEAHEEKSEPEYHAESKEEHHSFKNHEQHHTPETHEKKKNLNMSQCFRLKKGRGTSLF